MKSYSEVVSVKHSFDRIFGDFGKSIDYVFNIVYNLENIMDVGISSVNVVIINGEIPEEQVSELKRYHINHLAWKNDMIKYVQNPQVKKEIIAEFFATLSKDFQEEYLKRWKQP